MKKLFLIVFTLFIFSFAGKAVASEMPKGLENRGPLTKVSFIHYKKMFAKPSGVGNDGKISCYGFLGKGVYWKNNLPRTLYVNTESFAGLDSNFVLTTIGNSAETWDSQVNTDLFSSTTPDVTANWDNETPDGRSEIIKASYPNSGVIAVTNVWGYFSGPPQTRELVEWDMLLDQDDFAWGIGDATKMDLQNIVTHEIGHSAGMGDLYDGKCNTQTMYGYSTEGETSKRDLDVGDIKGIKTLYG